MAKKNLIAEIRERITDMQTTKANELKTIWEKKTQAETEKEAAELALKNATAVMDLEAYEEARAKKHKAQTAIDMYSSKHKQIETQEYISEEESDKVIASILNYEEERAAEFKADLAKLLKPAADLLATYEADIREAEDTIRLWTDNIHANYRSMTATFQDGTNRFPKPVPVRNLPYNGCNEATILKTFLEKEAKV